MRKIKFRAWDKYKKRMLSYHEGDFIKWRAPSNYDDVFNIMQHTGLKDVDGTDIYEGDIVQSDEYNNYLVMWDERKACFAFGLNKDDTNPDPIGDIFGDGKGYKVIGNVYENSELLECD